MGPQDPSDGSTVDCTDLYPGPSCLCPSPIRTINIPLSPFVCPSRLQLGSRTAGTTRGCLSLSDSGPHPAPICQGDNWGKGALMEPARGPTMASPGGSTDSSSDGRAGMLPSQYLPHAAQYISEWVHLYWVIYRPSKAALERILPPPPPPPPPHWPLGSERGHKFSQIA